MEKAGRRPRYRGKNPRSFSEKYNIEPPQNDNIDASTPLGCCQKLSIAAGRSRRLAERTRYASRRSQQFAADTDIIGGCSIETYAPCGFHAVLNRSTLIN